MKSSPFKLFSLSAREADQRGNYANPELGRYKATTFDHPDLSGIKNSKPKAKTEDSNTSSYEIPIKEFKTNFGETPDMPNLTEVIIITMAEVAVTHQDLQTTTTGGKSYRQAYAEAGKPGESYKQYVDRAEQWHKDNPGNRPSSITTTSSWKTDDSYSFGNEGITAMNMKGSPVKHNAGAAGAIGSDFSQAKNQYADIFSKSATTVGQNKQSGVGALQSFITRAKNQGGSMVGSISQQIGNQAQQRAADAGGSTSVDPFLPPPNQVAETGSYGGGGDRILEMDSNPVGNQSIGRDTDVASQLFGSGQRASMLAMKGTPLHTEGHGGAKGHTHAKPGDYLDQTVAEDMGVNDIEDYEPIQKFKGKQMVVNLKKKDTIFSTNSTFVIPKHMEGITRSTEGTPSPKPVYINRNKKQ